MSLSKYSRWFESHSVVKILALWFEFDDTPNPGSKNLSRSQLLDGVSCLSYGCAIFISKNGLCQEMVKKPFFGSSETALSNFKKLNLPLFMISGLNFSVFWNTGAISFTMILAKKSKGQVQGTKGSFVQQNF